MKIDIILDGLVFFLYIYGYVILARVIFSMLLAGNRPGPAMAGIFRILYALTEPLLAPLRKALPAVRMGAGYLDLSPIVLLIMINILRILVMSR